MGALSALGLFDPLVRDWFEERVGRPTAVQELAWPRIAAGEHVLVTAPTGSGKTLTAFLWAIDRLLTGAWPTGRVRVLYVSPLKALNSDVGRNLEVPLDELRRRFREADRRPPAVRSLTRSGDTPQSERQRMRRQPPEILITTPESLNILLTSQGGRAMLDGLVTVILDEIHAVAGSKRGTHLMTAVERLVRLSGEFQRIALSATVRPLDTVAAMVGGHELMGAAGDGGEAVYRPRPVRVVAAPAEKTYEVEVRYPVAQVAAGADGEDDDPDGLWRAMVPEVHRIVRRNRSTLVFANSRRLTEKVTRFLNEEGFAGGAGGELAYSHHGSLSREVRTVVEERLKRGELQAIVATSSLELGIDVGALDAVVLVQSPPVVSSAVQRIGRAGHQVGAVSRGIVFPTHGRDLLQAAVVARAVMEKDVEAVRPVVQALDVLAQVVLSMCVAEPWRTDDLYDQVRTAWAYRHLSRRRFDLLLEMLAGRYADSRIRELRPRVTVDRVAGTVRARPGVERLLYMAGGTIPDRGYFTLRVEGTEAKVGELDEEFVWERSLGDVFVLGAQSWRIERITHDEVVVSPGGSPTAMAPFWRADAQDRDAHFSDLVAAFLERAAERLDDAGFRDELARVHRLRADAADALLELLRDQRAATGQLPHRHRLVIERTADPMGRDDRVQLVFHTLWGGRVNRPLAMALAAAWEERHPEPLQVYQDDDCLLLTVPPDTAAEEVLSLVAADQVEVLLRRQLEASGFFGSRFRMAAQTALLLPRAGFRQRTPLWLTRQRAKKLVDTVSRYGDFPILVETWRQCLEDEFDLETLKARLGELASGEIAVEEVTTETPSPFAAEVVWQQTNTLMYADDRGEGGRGGAVREDVLRELVFASHLRPRLPAALVERFRRKVQRTAAGYAPAPGDELREWVGERLAIPEPEWAELLAVAAEDAGVSPAEVATGLRERVVLVTLPATAPATSRPLAVAVDRLPRLLRALGHDLAEVGLAAADDPASPPPAAARDAIAALWELAPPDAASPNDPGGDIAEATADLVAEWLRYQGALPLARLGEMFGLAGPRLVHVAGLLADSRRAVVDRLTAGADEEEIADQENLEILLRWLRLDRRPGFATLPAEALPLFLALHQGVAAAGDGVDDLRDRLERLFGYPAPAASWERDFLPARLAPYYPAWLDGLLQESDLLWLGCGRERLTFTFATDVELLEDEVSAVTAEGPGDGAVAAVRAALAAGAAEVEALAERAGLTVAATSDALWRMAWAGEVTNGTFLVVRRGLGDRFAPPAPPRPARPPGRRRGGAGWRPQRVSYGRWRLVDRDTGDLDALERDELAKDRARLLLARYGVVFRELVGRELPALAWRRVFRALRLLELSGEVVVGRFFAGVRGPQFASKAAFRRLRQGLPEDVVYWLTAADPASLAGIDVEGLGDTLPSRLPSSHLVYQGSRLVAVSRRRGRDLDLRFPPAHPRLAEYLAFLKVQLAREVAAASHVEVATINGEPAATSPYAEPLGELFRLTREGKHVRLWKRY